MQLSTEIKKKRDPNLDNQAVKKYRDIIHLQANHIQREEIAYTVGGSECEIRIWEGVLIEWMLHGYSPKNVLGMIKQYRATIDGIIHGTR